MPEGIQFEEQKFASPKYAEADKTSNIVKFLIDNRLAKDEKSATIVIGICLVLAFVAIIYLIVHSFSPAKTVPKSVSDKVMEESIRRSTQ